MTIEPEKQPETIETEEQPETIETEEQPETLYKRFEVPPKELYVSDPPFESYLHLRQMMLLIECLEWLWQDRDNFFVAGNLMIYYSYNQQKSEEFKAPDFFVALKTKPDRSRKSWILWEEEGRYPRVIVELLSESTANIDKGFKKNLYEGTFRATNYFWFDPFTLEFAGFYLVGSKYQPIEPNESGYLWSNPLNLYLGVYEETLRYFTPEGKLVPTPQEAALWEKQQRELAEEKAAKLAAKLRELNIDPDTL
jgi:Uma2 family endonuclease